MRHALRSARGGVSAMRAGFRATTAAVSSIEFRPERRRLRLHEMHAPNAGPLRDFGAVWQDFAKTIQKEADAVLHGSYKVSPAVDDSGRVSLNYRTNPQNKKMEDAGGWGE